MAKIRNIFRKESLEQYSTADLFNDYIKQAKLRWWVVASVLAVFIISLLLWAVFWKVPDAITCRGLVNGDGTVICYIPTEEVLDEEQLFSVTSFSLDGVKRKGHVETCEDYPLSRSEISLILPSDYLRSNLVTHDYSYSVILTPEDKRALPPEGTICDVAITVGMQSPLNMLVQ
jgi:hypothetical protein